jgi:hypothetical protein
LLDLIHSDVFGPMKVSSIYKDLYYVSIIYYYSRRTSPEFIRTNSKVFSQFKELKSLLENYIPRMIKVLRTNNGIDFYEVNSLFC